MVKYASCLLSLLALCISPVPGTSANGAAGKNADFCETFTDAVSKLLPIEVELKKKVDQFAKKNRDDFDAKIGYNYFGFCTIFLGEPKRPRHISTALWLQYDGYSARDIRTVSGCMAGYDSSRASARQLCKSAVREMEVTSKQHARDIRYLIDNVRLSTHQRSQRKCINPRYFIFYLQTLNDECTDLIQDGDCKHSIGCFEASDKRFLNGTPDFSTWRSAQVLPGCRIAKHTALLPRLITKLNRLHEHYRKPLAWSMHFSVTELEAENRSDDGKHIAELSTTAIAKLAEIRKRGTEIIAKSQTETLLGLCLTTLGDMQTVAEDYFNEIMAIRETVSRFR